MCKKIKIVTITFDKILTLFHLACSYKSNMYFLIKNPNCFDTDSLTYSSIVVNGILGLELYFKFLKSFELYELNKIPQFYKTHNLKMLFNDLKEEMQNNICNQMLIEYKYQENYIKDFLEEHCNDFTDYRYLTKNENYFTDVSLIAKLNDVLCRISKKLINSKDLSLSKNEFLGTYDDDLIDLVNSQTFFIKNDE